MIKNAYKLISNRLSEKDVCFLQALENHTKIAQIIERTGWSKALVNTYKYRLMEKGVVQQVSRGILALSLPEFDLFIEEFL